MKDFSLEQISVSYDKENNVIYYQDMQFVLKPLSHALIEESQGTKIVESETRTGNFQIIFYFWLQFFATFLLMNSKF